MQLPLLYPPSRAFRRVSLEMSLKPFYDDTPQMRTRVAEKLFRQWMPLCHRADVISLMLWAADGSEILDYRGDLDDSFEWAYWLGSANKWVRNEEENDADAGRDEQGIGLGAHKVNGPKPHLHAAPYLYRENPPQFTYRWLKDLILDFKNIGEKLTGKPIEVGLTFDPGPEFAVSDFKYRRHRELCEAGLLWGKTFVPCNARLHGDAVAYAAYPQGIPAGTGIGTFLGKQTARLHDDLGFDFIWFSNGFGFGGETWSLRGALFDGEIFHPEKAAQQKQEILEFWRDFRRECALPIRTRGTNLSTGVDVASDGVPLREIYAMPGVEAPVNSPWAALDGDFGLELAGWMSHSAILPDGNFNFRYYAHDPWWMNSPWFDRYERRAHDIFLPMTVSRLDENGAAQPPDNLSILTVDNSHGQLPDTFAAEIAAHLLRARELSPDAPGPLLWIYPFNEYHDAVFENGEAQNIYFGDWFARGLINNGVPLNSVASTECFLKAFGESPARFAETILVTPVPRSAELQNVLLEHARSGGKVLLYGPIENEEMAALFSLETAPGWDGDLNLYLSESTRAFFEGEPSPKNIHHSSLFSGGALAQRLKNINSEVEPLAWVGSENDRREIALLLEMNGGSIAWLRGPLSADETRTARLLPAPLDKDKYFQCEALARAILARFGLEIKLVREAAQRTPVFATARSRGAFVFAGYNPDEAAASFRLPQGVPLPLGQRVTLQNGAAHFTVPAAWLAECRVLVQQESGTLYVQEVPSIMAGVRRRWLVKGLESATLRFYAVDEGDVQFLVNPIYPYLEGDFRTPPRVESPGGDYYELPNISGDLLISW